MKNLLIAASLTFATASWADAATEAWSSKCKSCHGEDGKGETKMGKKSKVKDLSAGDWQAKHTDAQIRDAIADGIPDTKMDGFKKKLDAAQIDALVKYVRSLKG